MTRAIPLLGCSGAFEGLGQLQSVNLENNQITAIELADGSFDGLASFADVHLL
jgi:hypothetical protein